MDVPGLLSLVRPFQAVRLIKGVYSNW